MPTASVPLYRVPGAWEIPVCAEYVLQHTHADVIIALGVILQGKTLHAEHLGLAVTNALQRASFEYGLPVIHAVLSLKNEAQARKRCLEDEMNRGTEAARAAVEMASVLAELRK
jgi:6,7-dimethyl-8-ribityllumazine synthase